MPMHSRITGRMKNTKVAATGPAYAAGDRCAVVTSEGLRRRGLAPAPTKLLDQARRDQQGIEGETDRDQRLRNDQRDARGLAALVELRQHLDRRPADHD